MKQEQVWDEGIFSSVAKELASFAKLSYQRGWSPATSTNFSVRMPGRELLVAITRSGIDKAFCEPQDILLVDTHGLPLENFSGKPSAETPLHLSLYRTGEDVGAVIHTHSLPSTVLSMENGPEGKITFSQFEILKGLRGVTTHLTTEELPIFPNTQDMDDLGQRVEAYLKRPGRGPVFGVLIEGHGLYAWGKDLSEAKRHGEVYEFLLQCTLSQNSRQRGY